MIKSGAIGRWYHLGKIREVVEKKAGIRRKCLGREVKVKGIVARGVKGD